mgnify:CR=1 FL=1
MPAEKEVPSLKVASTFDIINKRVIPDLPFLLHCEIESGSSSLLSRGGWGFIFCDLEWFSLPVPEGRGFHIGGK